MHLTAEKIQQRLGFSSIAMPGKKRFGAREIATIREAGITRIEIGGLRPPTHYDYHDAAQVSEITTECRKQGISIVSVHGPDLPYDCPYEDVRRAVVREALASTRMAEEMGASIFVGHFGTNEHSERTVRELIERLGDVAIRLTIENLPPVPDLRDYVAFVERIGCDRFGITVDIGHPRDADGVNPFVKAGRAREAMALCEDRLFHVHLHDFVDCDHYAPFDGTVKWDEVFLALEDIHYVGEFMFEACPRISVEDTLKKTAAFPKAFALRYGACVGLPTLNASNRPTRPLRSG